LLVELGTHHGVSYAAFCEAVSRLRLTTRCYAVDSWAGDKHAGYYGDDVYYDLKNFNDKRYSWFSELLKTTFDEACSQFADGTIDLLHIDGFHTYESVRHDFETWHPKLSDHAIVLFHDTNVRKDDFGVWRFFDELKNELPTFEFLHGYGLGLAIVGEDAPPAVRELCGLTCSDDIAVVRERFSRLGAQWVDLFDKTESIARKDAQIADMAVRLQELESALANTNAALANTGAVLAEKEAQVAQANNMIGNISERYSAWVRRDAAQLKTPPPSFVDTKAYDAIRNSAFFDAEFYLEANPDVNAAETDPALHYLLYGSIEGRNPGPFFLTNAYLSANPDVAATGMNALVHYELYGRCEARSVGFRSYARSVDDRVSSGPLPDDNSAVNLAAAQDAPSQHEASQAAQRHDRLTKAGH